MCAFLWAFIIKFSLELTRGFACLTDICQLLRSLSSFDRVLMIGLRNALIQTLIPQLPSSLIWSRLRSVVSKRHYLTYYSNFVTRSYLAQAGAPFTSSSHTRNSASTMKSNPKSWKLWYPRPSVVNSCIELETKIQVSSNWRQSLFLYWTPLSHQQKIREPIIEKDVTQSLAQATWSLPNRSQTYDLLHTCRTLYHWATGDLRELRPYN